MKPIFRLLHKPIYNARLRALSDAIVPHLRPGDRILDVGCGSGLLATQILSHPQCPSGTHIEGLERVSRGNEPITVTQYDGSSLPFDENSFDVVIIADVLHHENDPNLLLSQCARVASRAVIIKDHKPEGLLAQPRISFMDWAANVGYSVPCLYRYNTLTQWRDCFKALGLTVAYESTSLSLYPPVVNILFGRRLQYLAVVTPPEQTTQTQTSYNTSQESQSIPQQ
jgi:SAM-dependent methyltransferase